MRKPRVDMILKSLGNQRDPPIPFLEGGCPHPSFLKFLVFMRMAGICGQRRERVGLRDKIVLPKMLGSIFWRWRKTAVEDGREIENDRYLSQAEAPNEDAVRVWL